MVGDVFQPEINQDEATQDAMVEDEVDPIVGVSNGDAVLASDEGEALAEFQQEGLEVVAESGFQVRLGQDVRLLDLEEFENEVFTENVGRVGDDLTLAGEDGILVLPGGEAQKKGRAHLALELGDSPFFPERLLRVESTFQRVVDLEKFDQMGPAQFVRRRRTNWENKVVTPETTEVTATEPLAMKQRQVTTEAVHQGFAVASALLAALLELNDLAPDFPLGFGQVVVDGLGSSGLARGVPLRDAAQKVLIPGVPNEFLTHARTSEMLWFCSFIVIDKRSHGQKLILRLP
jgi:hypothetical protein